MMPLVPLVLVPEGLVTANPAVGLEELENVKVVPFPTLKL
jgi:hypothetical protein